MSCGTILVPFNAPRASAAAKPGTVAAQSTCVTDGAQCTNGGILAFSAFHAILAGATGTTFVVPIAPGVPGDHFVLEPFGNARQRLHAIQVDVATVAADLPFISRGHFQHNGNRVGATMNGGFANVVGPPAIVMDCDRYLKCGISPTNGQCLEPYGANDELLVGWANSDAVGVRTVTVTYEIENVG